jgi:hypothetical protein
MVVMLVGVVRQLLLHVAGLLVGGCAYGQVVIVPLQCGWGNAAGHRCGLVDATCRGHCLSTTVNLRG